MIDQSAFDCFKIHPRCKAECCSDITPLPLDIYERNQDKIVREPLEFEKMPGTEMMMVNTSSHKCVFLNEDFTCNIYDERPPICKTFGDESHPMMFCSYMSKCGRERSRQEKRMIERKSKKWVKGFNRMVLDTQRD